MIAFALITGALAGGGVWLMVRGFAPPPPPLGAALADLERPRWNDGSGEHHSRSRRWAVALTDLTGTSAATQRNLDLLERPVERHALDKLTYMVVGAGLPLGGWALMGLGGVVTGGLYPVVLSALGGIGGFFLPDVLLRAEADRYRRDFIGQLTLYLNLVVVLLAGGRGVEGALVAAASVGDGAAFLRIRRALTTAQLNRESPWRSLDRLAQQLDIPALAELAASATLAGETGAKVRESLAAKAVSLRSRLLSEAEAAAHRRSETMTAPVVMMLTGFIVLIGFPAVHTLLTF